MRRLFRCLFISVLLFALCGCAPREASVQFFAMDTYMTLSASGKGSEETLQKIQAEITRLESLLDRTDESSLISQLNRANGASVSVDEETCRLLSASAAYADATGGAFDITVAPVVSAWGFTSDQFRVPTQSELETLLQTVGTEHMTLSEKEAALSPNTQIDLGGIAKGAACDIVRQVAEEYGVTRGYVSIGGNIVALEKKPFGSDFWFGIRDPQRGANDSLCAVQLYGKTMATTGAYERFFEQDGVTYHHVLDPQTGWPADSDLLSVSVICEDGALADYLSTTLYVLGKETVLDCLERQDFQLIAVGEDGKVYCSSSLKGEMRADPAAAYEFVYGERQ